MDVEAEVSEAVSLLLRGLHEAASTVVQDATSLLGLDEGEPVRRYDPPVRPSYAEPVSHPSDSVPQRTYTGAHSARRGDALPLTFPPAQATFPFLWWS